MTTGSFWNTTKEFAPWGYHDKDSVIIYPIDWNTWLADSGTTYASHTVTAELPFEVSASTQAAGIIYATIRKKAGEDDPTIGQKYYVRCHIVCANGEEQDRTLYLKVVEM